MCYVCVALLSGPWLDGSSLYGLMEDYRVTVSLGVPTVWLGLLSYMDQNKLKFSTFKMVVRQMPHNAGAKAPHTHPLDVFPCMYTCVVCVCVCVCARHTGDWWRCAP